MMEDRIVENHSIQHQNKQMQQVIDQYWLSWQDFQYADCDYVYQAIERLQAAEEMVITYMPDAIRFLPSLN